MSRGAVLSVAVGSPCVGTCRSWHRQDLVVTLPSSPGRRDEPEDALGSGAMQVCPKSRSKGDAGSVPIPGMCSL